jgi:hypothetical protein
MGFTLDQRAALSVTDRRQGRVVCDTDRFEMNAPTCAFRRRANRCLREAQFAELGKFHYLWAEQIFSYGDSDAGPEGGLNRSTQHFILKERWSVL